MIFDQHENDIVTLKAEDCLVVIGSYTGNGDPSVDKAAADTVLAALFPGRYKEECTVNVSANTATATVGAFSAELMPLVYKNNVLLEESAYSFVAATGVFSAFNPVLSGDDIVTVTLAKYVPGVQTVEPVADLPVKVADVKAFGSNAYVYRTTSNDDDKYTINVKGAYDRKLLRRKYGPSDLEKSVFGTQWNAGSGVANQVGRNSNPFFVAIIWWYPDATTGELMQEKLIFYKCTLNKALFPKPEGTDKEASFEIDATSLSVYRVKTLGS